MAKREIIDLEKDNSSSVLPLLYPIQVAENGESTCQPRHYSKAYYYENLTSSQEYQVLSDRSNQLIKTECYLEWDNDILNKFLIYLTNSNYNEKSIFSLIDTFNLINPFDKQNRTWTDVKGEISECLRNLKPLREIIDRIKSFSKLEENWDSYGAKHIEWPTISRAIGLFSKIIYIAQLNNKTNIPNPFVCPLADGGICFEWITIYKELIFSISETDELYFDTLTVQKVDESEVENEQYLMEKELIDKVINWFL